MKKKTLFLFLSLALMANYWLLAQGTGQIQGEVTLQRNGLPLHKATVMMVQLNRVEETDADGRFVFENVPPGTYDVIAYTASLSTNSALVEVRDGETEMVNFQLTVAPLKEEITVTAKGRQETAFEAVHSVDSLDSFDIAERMAPSLGELLEGQTGVSKRSFGPGSARPVIRGFDGDRVLVMQDGVRVGSLASQSGDHGEPIDPTSVERVEVVKGPATLLYGSNAIGGVVNAVSGHHEIHQQAHEGIRGSLSSVVGSNAGQVGASANAEFGTGSWLFWVAGGGQRAGDYETPVGEIENSKTRISNASAGMGWYGERVFAAFEYMFNDGRYGIPFAAEFHGHEEGDGHPDEGGPVEEPGQHEEEELEAVDVDFRRNYFRFSGGFRNLAGWIDAFRLSLNYADWSHDELEVLEGGIEEIGTAFDNEQFVYRGVFEQSQRGPLSGSFGFWGLLRDYEVAGEEALSPPVDQDSFALFALEELGFEGWKLQLGGRLEHTDYAPQSAFEQGGDLVFLPDRDFTGLSAGIGTRFEMGQESAFVANFTSSFRAPALEELYNFGPHVGNLAFEIGNPDLEGERSTGLDLSLRRSSDRLRGEVNFFYYDINDFIFLAPTGGIEDGLIEANYSQGDSRFVGTEAELDVALHDYLWLDLGLSLVDAELTDFGTPLPRIPPLKGRVALDFRYDRFSFRPEVVLSDRQNEIFPTEVETAGYGVVNLRASYTLPSQHFVHHFSVNVFNVGDALYRNHLSFIKELAPEMGRGVRFSYAVKFF